MKLTTDEREQFKRDINTIKNNVDNCIAALELEDDDKFVLEFVMLAMLGGTMVNSLQQRLMTIVKRQKIGGLNETLI